MFSVLKIMTTKVYHCRRYDFFFVTRRRTEIMSELSKSKGGTVSTQKNTNCVEWRLYLTMVLVFFDSECYIIIQGGSNMTGTDLYVNKPHCAATTVWGRVSP